MHSETPTEPVSEDTTIPISTPPLVRTTIQDLQKRVSVLETGLSTVQTTIKEVKDNQRAQERKFSDQMEFLTGVMQQILDKLSSGQPSQIAPTQVLEDSSTKGEKGTVSVVDKGKRIMEAGSSAAQGEQYFQSFDFEQTLEEGEIPHEPYIPVDVLSVPVADDLEDENLFVNDEAYHNDCLGYDLNQVEDEEARRECEARLAYKRELRKKKLDEFKARKLDNSVKAGAEWDTTRKLLAKPEIGSEKNDDAELLSWLERSKKIQPKHPSISQRPGS